jgi:ribosomal protein S18 acetylase RimI-like enzyme
MIKIRPAQHADIESMLHLLEALFSIEQDFTPDKEKQQRGLEMLLQAPQAYVVLAERGGEVAGMATLQLLISTAEGAPSGLIEDVVVHELHRGQGIGEALMKHLITWAEQKGVTRLQLLADRDNQPALDFYRKQGWETTRLIALRKRP